MQQYIQTFKKPQSLQYSGTNQNKHLSHFRHLWGWDGAKYSNYNKFRCSNWRKIIHLNTSVEMKMLKPNLIVFIVFLFLN